MKTNVGCEAPRASYLLRSVKQLEAFSLSFGVNLRGRNKARQNPSGTLRFTSSSLEWVGLADVVGRPHFGLGSAPEPE